MNQFPTRELPAAPAPPLWGKLTDDGTTAAVLRLTTQTGSISLPYHVINGWELNRDGEQLLLHTVIGTALVEGTGLALLRDALDEGRLLQLKPTPERLASADPAAPRIRDIRFIHPRSSSAAADA